MGCWGVFLIFQSSYKMLFHFLMQQLSATFLFPNAHNSTEKSSRAPEFMQCFVRIHHFNTRDLKPQSESWEATSQQLRLSARGLGQRNLAVLLLQRPGCTRTKASPSFQVGVLSMNWADSRRCSPRCLAEGRSVRLLSQFYRHKGGDQGTAALGAAQHTSKQGSCSTARSHPAAAAQGSPRHGKALQGGQPGLGDSLIPWSPSLLPGNAGEGSGGTTRAHCSGSGTCRVQGRCLWQITLPCQGKQKIARHSHI